MAKTETYDIRQALSPDAEAAIKNALRQHGFYKKQKGWGPSFSSNDRQNKTRTFKEVHPSFNLFTNFGSIEIMTFYKETIKELVYFMNVYINSGKLDNADGPKYLKHILSGDYLNDDITTYFNNENDTTRA